jgi:hypothetical protein
MSKKEVATTDAMVETQFPMVYRDNSAIIESMKINLENESITKRDMFTVIPNPKGEAEWAVKLPTGKQIFETLDAVILHIGNERAYYEQEWGTGDNTPPDCSSDNGVIGIGSPGGKCVDCEFAQFGPNNEAPQCSQKKPLYLLVPEINPINPVVLYATGPSFPNIKKFNINLMQFGINIYDVKVKLSLEVKKTKNNMDASIINIETIGNIKTDDPIGYEKLTEYRSSLLGFINPVYREVQAAASGSNTAA